MDFVMTSSLGAIIVHRHQVASAYRHLQMFLLMTLVILVVATMEVMLELAPGHHQVELATMPYLLHRYGS